MSDHRHLWLSRGGGPSYCTVCTMTRWAWMTTKCRCGHPRVAHDHKPHDYTPIENGGTCLECHDCRQFVQALNKPTMEDAPR